MKDYFCFEVGYCNYCGRAPHRIKIAKLSESGS
jgi:hypothetical protein